MARSTRIRRGFSLFALVAALSLPAGSAIAAALPSQETQPKPRRASALGDRSTETVAHVPELRDETFRLMDAYVISNIQESLGLSDEQFTKVLPLVKRLHTERRELARRRMEALRSLRKALKSGASTESTVADLLKEVKTATIEERAAASRNAEALDASLSLLQQAKYRIFEAEVELRLRHLLSRSEAREKPAPR